jgi:hypothetical protein
LSKRDYRRKRERAAERRAEISSDRAARKKAAKERRIRRIEQKNLIFEQTLAKKNDPRTLRVGSDGQWSPLVTRHLTAMRDLHARARFEQLLEFVEAKIPKLATADFVIPLQYIATHPWIAELEDWQARGRGARSLFDSLVRHLLCKYPVPPFLLSAFHIRGLTGDVMGALIRLFAHIGKGGSVYKATKREIGTLPAVCPVPLTKKMCHLFITSKTPLNMMEALRTAQVLGYGGDARLARAICGTSIGRVIYTNEDFWATVIQWLCGQAMLDPNEIGPIVDWIDHRKRENRNFAMKGRNAVSVMKAMRVWHREMRQVRYSARWNYPEKFESCGLKGYKLETQAKLPNGQKHPAWWTVTEIVTKKELQAEGREQRHCVFSYGRRIMAKEVSIWSLKYKIAGGVAERCVTIEVINNTKSIVQARRFANKKPTNAEERIINAWSQKQGLLISRY